MLTWQNKTCLFKADCQQLPFTRSSIFLAFTQLFLPLIIMYIYHVLINALSANIMYINLNTILYTHIEHSPTKTIYIRYYMETHTHTHNVCTCTHTCTHTHTDTHTLTVAQTGYSYQLGWKYCEKRKVFSLALKDDWVEQCQWALPHPCPPLASYRKHHLANAA